MSRPRRSASIAEVLADQLLAFVRPVPLVEHEVDDVENGIEAGFDVGGAREIERQPSIANLPLRPDDPLRDCRFFRQERARDLADAEAADRLEAERDARVPRNFGMAAHHDHPQLVVAELLVEIGIGRRDFRRARQVVDDGVGLVAEGPDPANDVDRAVVGDAEQPPGGIVRYALIRPGLQGAQHRLLHALLREVDVGRPEEPRQTGRHAARLMPEQVLEQHRAVGRIRHDPYICLTSIVPPYSRCGWSSVRATASS